MSNRVRILAGVVAVVIVGLGVVAGTALAQDAGNGGSQAPAEGAASGLCARFVEGVASQLGVTVDELEAAFKTSKLDILDEAVQSGKIDADTAQRIRERIEEGSACWRPRPRVQRLGERVARGLVIHAAAETLDMTPRELIRQFQECTSLAQVAEEQGVGRDELKSSILDDVQKHLDQAVTKGRISQERADQALQKLTDNIDEIVDAVRCPAGATGT
jgi:polyhydroxyalkanoate synthesis regulator phasin